MSEDRDGPEVALVLFVLWTAAMIIVLGVKSNKHDERLDAIEKKLEAPK